MPVKQIKVGFDNFSYVIYDQELKKAAIVDPSYDASNSIKFVKENDFDLVYIINTHYHSDHTSANNKIKDIFPKARLISSKEEGLQLNPDITVSDKNHLKIGNIDLEFLLTPGHTKGGICIIVDNEALITGDTLFIGDCGRTDLAGGDLYQMFETLQRIKSLPDNLMVYPGHDYGSKPFDTLKNQKKTNKVLIAKNIDEFSKIP